MKILYAAGASQNSKIQLARFASTINENKFSIKYATYNKSSNGLPIDWSLDSLLNMFKPDLISMDNENFHIYFEQIRSFAPELIISDLEYFSSYIANVLNIPLWQCSSSLINIAISNHEKYNIGLFKTYSYLLHNKPVHNARIANIIDNSNNNFVYSHLGDLENAPSLKDKFEWVRPYFSLGKISKPCSHNIVAGMNRNNKKLFNILQKYTDSVVFSNFCDERYNNLQLKNINNQEEYFCNLKNSNLFVCEGQTSFLADAYYNNRYSVVMTDYTDLECIINSKYSEHMKISSLIYGDQEDLNQFIGNEIISNQKDNIKFLHQKLENL